MMKYILDLRPPDNGEPVARLRGELATLSGPRDVMHGKHSGGSYLLTACYRDHGADGTPPLTTEARVVLHARSKRAALFDAAEGVTVMEVATLKRSRRICAQLGAGSHLVFKDVNLAGIVRVEAEISAGAGHGGILELRADHPAGPLVGRVEVPVTGEWASWKTIHLPVSDPGGVRDLYVVAARAPAGEMKRFNLDALGFVSAEPAPNSRGLEQPKKRENQRP